MRGEKQREVVIGGASCISIIEAVMKLAPVEIELVGRWEAVEDASRVRRELRTKFEWLTDTRHWRLY